MGRQEPYPPTYLLYMCCYTDWVWTVVTTDSCPLCQSNGSLTCPFEGGVTAGVHKEGLDMFIPLRWMTKMTRMTRNLKSRPWEWLAEVYGNLVIVVILVMEGVWTGQCYAQLQCITDMPCMTLRESLGVFRYCIDAKHRGCNRIGVWESGDDTEGWGVSLSV